MVGILAGGGAYPFSDAFCGGFAGGMVRIAGFTGIYRPFALSGQMAASDRFCRALADFLPVNAVKVVPGRFQGDFERPGKPIIKR